MKERAAFILATWFGSGLIKPAPGSWGSLAALPFAYFLIHFNNITLYVIVTAVVFFIGMWATAIYSAQAQKEDASEIVIDEVVGQWIALWPWLFLVQPSIWGYVAAFLLFRFFDILKPWPISLADRRHDAWGVMLDDVVAGLMAALVSWGVIFYAF